MRFRTRLMLFFTVTLVAIQLAAFVATRAVLRETLIEDGKAQVAAAEVRFVRQMSELKDHLAEGVRLLTLDFALRRAIADRDSATVLSALRNHGRRIGAGQMLLIDSNGVIEGDTIRGSAHVAANFPYRSLLDRAIDEDRAGSVAIMDGKPVWLMVVPVMAPDLIAYVAAVLPLDDAALTRIRDVAGVPGRIGIVMRGDDGWIGLAGMTDAAVLRQLSEIDGPRAVIGADGDETIVTSRILPTTPDGGVVRVVLDYPLSDVLWRHKRVIFVLLPILFLGLFATLLGASIISRSVARPIEILAQRTRRIAEGDYAASPPLRRTDELGQLSVALYGMTRAIADREERIRHQATHDPVTGLPNRAAIAALIDAGPAGGSRAILVVGLSRWREIIGAVGRTIGDRMLREAALRIRTCLAASAADGSGEGSPPIGGIGERTFAVLLDNDDQAAAIATAARVIAAFETPWQDGELTIDAPVAVGIALLPEHGTDAEQLLRRAEVALQAAYGAEIRLAVYRLETDPHRAEQLSLMSDLRVGLERGEFELLFQPKLDLKQGRIAAAEALVRWRHPARGLVMPDDFIVLAEETGNIQHLTRWVLRAGLTEVRRWLDQGLPVRVSINVSVRDLADASLADRISALLCELGLPARTLVLEITESAIMAEPEAAIATLRRLRQLGIDLAIDDFGVGQSSLAYLRRLPVREIKLDKTFVRTLPDSPDDRIIVRSITELGHNLGYLVTAEGVEDAACLRLLRSYGCDHAQGYFVGKPLPADAFMEFAKSWREPAPVQLAADPP